MDNVKVHNSLPLTAMTGPNWRSTPSFQGHRNIALILFSALFLVPTVVAEKPGESSTRIFVAPQDGFEVFLKAAMIKKEVPATLVTDEQNADYILKSAPL
jgi:hypothetical protein